MREDLVKSAVSFLSSEKVKTADKEKKTQFLKQKGLNEEEINEAFKRIDASIPSSPNTATSNIEASNTSPFNTAPKLPPRTPSLYQPIQVVYYAPPPTPRMDSRQIIRYALAIGVSAFGITVAVTAIVKTIMSKFLNSIANYQGNRYTKHRIALSRIEAALKDFSQTTDNSSIEDEQTELYTSLDRLVETINSTRRKDNLYKKCESSLIRFKNSLTKNSLISPPSTYPLGSYSGAERYQVNKDQNNIITSIKSDIRSVKGSLLSRRNFPTAARQSIVSQQPATFVPPPPSTVDPNANHPRNRHQRVMQSN